MHEVGFPIGGSDWNWAAELHSCPESSAVELEPPRATPDRYLTALGILLLTVGVVLHVTVRTDQQPTRVELTHVR